MKFAIFILLLFSFYTVEAVQKIKVGIIDTGFGFGNRDYRANLCIDGHKDFTISKTVYTQGKISYPADTHGHGTNVVGIIQSYVNNPNICFVILKIYGQSLLNDNLYSEIAAIKYAKSIGIKFLNISGGGTEYSESEKEAVQDFLQSGGIIMAAAGNDGIDLSVIPYYPAMLKSQIRSVKGRIVVVGNKHDGKIVKSSNYGTPVDVWEDGMNINGFGISMTGTSQSTAVATGKLLQLISKELK